MCIGTTGTPSARTEVRDNRGAQDCAGEVGEGELEWDGLGPRMPCGRACSELCSTAHPLKGFKQWPVKWAVFVEKSFQWNRLEKVSLSKRAA